nr:MAG TPA: hypothetical protein [Caudoviricetes sp.]
MTEREKEANTALQEIAKDIQEKLPDGMGFALLAFEFGDKDDRRMMYVSNADREYIQKSMLEFCNKVDKTNFGKDV